MAATTSALQIIQKHRMSPSPDLPDKLWSIIEQHRGELVNQALAILGRLEDAEDAVQETFCEAFRNSERISEARSLGAWLRSINRANALDRRRRQRRDQRDAQTGEGLGGRTFTTGGFSLLELRESMAKAIEALPDELRAVVVLRYWEHLAYEEIAARLDLPLSTVWRRFSEASTLLYGKLKGSMEQSGSAAGANQQEKGPRP